MKTRADILQIISFIMVAGLIAVICISMTETKGSSRSMDEIAPLVVEAFDTDNACESSDRYLKKYYGLNASDYEDVVLYFPNTNMDAEELLIVQLKSTDQAEEVQTAIEERQKTQIGIYEGYAPQQLSLCENAVIDVQGNYVLYAVHENASYIDSVFRAALK